MSRFFFHVIDELDCPDAEGAELPGLDAARIYAGKALLGMAAETMTRTGCIGLGGRIEIEDDRHATVATVYLRDVLKIEG